MQGCSVSPDPRTSVNPPSAPASPRSPIETASESAFFFDSHDRPLYAVYHEAQRPRPGAPVAVVVASLGVEQLVNYRNRVLTARALAARGIPVLRYHPRGHGDSAGNWSDVTLGSLIEDARRAAEVALERSGASEVMWLATRFGALAAAGASGDVPTAALGMWEPTHRPREYFRTWLRALLFAKVARGESPAFSADELLARVHTDGHVDVHGYHLYRTLLESAEHAELGTLLARWAGPTMLVQIQGRRQLTPENQKLLDALTARGARVQTEIVNQEVGWQFIQNPAWESPELIAGTVEWADAVA